MKIFDSFLFFQELDLLEIRLRYLNDSVDYFIILESSRTFTGIEKGFLFERNIKRFEKYSNKILYFKLDNSMTSYSSLKKYLINSKNEVDKKIVTFLESHNHYPKNNFHWVTEAYNREALHHMYAQYIKEDDILMLSDLDEIPSLDFVNAIKKKITTNNSSIFYVAGQIELKYFINLMSPDHWYGTLAGRYRHISKFSLNILRLDSKTKRQFVSKIKIKNQGFHFSGCGGEKLLLSKIESGGHQELNFRFMKKNMFKRICAGYDSFSLTPGKSLKFIDINITNLFDTKLRRILLSYEHLALKNLSKLNLFDYLQILLLKPLIFIKRASNKLSSLL
jgi:beta-1,4-mannosyl-glycoprotein beta-1,4-N-acetylglucosaminyltransferase